MSFLRCGSLGACAPSRAQGRDRSLLVSYADGQATGMSRISCPEIHASGEALFELVRS